MPRALPALVLAIAATALPAAARAGTPEEDFQAAENTFRFQDYRAAEAMLRALLYPDVRPANPDQVLKAREYLGACYWWLKDERRMDEEFTSLLVASPAVKLDPFYYPAPLIERFESLRRQLLASRVISLEGPRNPNPEPAAPRCERQEERVVQRNRIASYLPFGIGQFQNGQPTKGALFLTGQALMLATNIGGWAGAEALRGPNGQYSAGDADRARSLRIVQYVGLGAFVGLVVWGIVDSALNFKPEDHSLKIGPCPAPAVPAHGPGAGVSPVPMAFCVGTTR